MKSKSLFWIGALFSLLSLVSGGLCENVSLLRGHPVEAEAAPDTKGGSKEKPLASPLPEAEIPKQAMGKIDLYILAGQSNMAGYGEIKADEIEVDPRIFLFGNDYRWKLAREPIDDATGQVDLVSEDTEAGFSCGIAFAKALLENNPNAFIGLIPCARHGSTIEEWQRNLSDRSLYGSCLKRALAASPMGRIRGLLFFQGETDALDPGVEPHKIKHPHEWGKKFSAFVKDIRRDLKVEELPVVFAQLGPSRDQEAFRNWGVVQDSQSKVRLRNCKMIKTKDLSLRDKVHFDNRSYRAIGERFGLAIIELLKRGQNP